MLFLSFFLSFFLSLFFPSFFRPAFPVFVFSRPVNGSDWQLMTTLHGLPSHTSDTQRPRWDKCPRVISIESPVILSSRIVSRKHGQSRPRCPSRNQSKTRLSVRPNHYRCWLLTLSSVSSPVSLVYETHTKQTKNNRFSLIFRRVVSCWKIHTNDRENVRASRTFQRRAK